MTTRRVRTGNLLAMRAEAGKQVDRIPASRFPVQHEIQHLQNELNAFNDRIIELENEGHRGHAMEVLKAKAIDFARQIDELRCLLVGPLTKPRGDRIQKATHSVALPKASHAAAYLRKSLGSNFVEFFAVTANLPHQLASLLY